MTSIPNAATRGQRRGFYWQDWYAARTMLRCVTEPAEGIIAVEVEAADAPHVDDVVERHSDLLIYRQLKHTVDENGRFTGANLFSVPEGGISLIGKLYKGWSRVRGRAGLRVEVHLTTNASGSPNPQNLLISPIHFERLVLEPARQPDWSPDDETREVVETLLRLTHAPDLATLREFLAALHLDLEAPAEAALKRDVIRLLRMHLRSESTLETEAEAWMTRVYDLSTRYGETGALSRVDIDRELRRLLHCDRLIEHRLALPDDHLERPQVADQILAAARDQREGYLVVAGPPGCGKTTLATWIANAHEDELLVRYHVFDPMKASRVERRQRASALEFIATMFDVLSERFPDTVAPRLPSPDRLGDAVGALRDLLARLAVGGPRFVIVDGIDHVVRAGMDRETIFDAIPQPAPAGVVFILFGQPDWEYPEWLRRAARVNIPQFSAVESRAIVCRRLGWAIDDTAAAAAGDAIHERSGGNPLSLFYNLSLIERIGTDPVEVIESLEKVALFGPAPHMEYDRLLEDLELQLPMPQGSRSLRQEMLACVAIATAAVTEERLRIAFSADGLTQRQAHDYLTGLRPVVVERDSGRFWLFHDDFRRYAEQRTSVEDREVAHRRFAIALDVDRSGDELVSFAEHCWLGRSYERLADLPRQRRLDEWFEASPAGDVVDMHRLATAAALRLHDDVRIMGNAFVASLAAEAADLPSELGSGSRRKTDMVRWSFVAPPRGVEFQALRQRAHALDVAADGCRLDAALAAEIANRFLAPRELLLEASENDIELQEYTKALTRWFLRSGRPSEVLAVLAQDALEWAVIQAVSEALRTERDPGVLGEWVSVLAGQNEVLDREIIGMALEHLIAGRDASTARIVRTLLGAAQIVDEDRRDARVLLSLVEGQVHSSASDIDTLVRWDEQGMGIPLGWRESFFHGFATTAAGSRLELSVCELPPNATPSTNGEREPSLVRLAAFIWKAGCAAGLAMRHGDLLTLGELESCVLPLMGKGGPDLEPIYRNFFDNIPRVFLPLMARAVRRWPELCEPMRALMVDLSRTELATPSARLYGALEAVWALAPDAWRTIAQAVNSVTFMPGSGPEDRAEWYQYWLSSAQERGMSVPSGLLGRSLSARIGVPRKTDPAALATGLISRELGSSETSTRIRRLVDLLIRLDGEPEGRRAAYRHLPEVLSAALMVDPGLFEWVFTRCVIEGEISSAEAFGSLPAEVAVRWLRSGTTLTANELVTTWQWVAAAPGGLDSDSDGSEARAAILERLKQVGATADSAQLEEWSSSMQLPLPRKRNESRDEVRAAPREAQPSPRIEEVTPRWLSDWWGEEHHRILRAFVASGGDRAWGEVCDHLAQNLVESSTGFATDFLLIAEGICDLRPELPKHEAVELALGYLSAKLRFQVAPPPVEIAMSTRCVLDVLVGLIARGLDVRDVETVRRALRSLAALVERAGTREYVVSEMQTRLQSEHSAIVQSALCILRRAGELPDQVREEVRRLEHHPDAWCRAIACSLLGVKPVWPAARRVVTGTGIIVPGAPEPERTELGTQYYARVSSVREVYVRKFRSLLDIDEQTLRSELETELRAAPARSELPLGWRRNLGPSLTAATVAEAAGRLASRLASRVSASVAPALLAAVARFDPWLVLAAPAKHPPPDWIEVCRAETLREGGRQSYLLRSLATIPDGALRGPDPPSCEQVAQLLCRGLFPVAPEEYGWVAEPWDDVAPPKMRGGVFVPLVFRNSLFTQLRRDRYDLVPAFGLPLFHGLSFGLSEGPQWSHRDLGPVLMAAHGERVAEAGGVGHAAMDWWTGWFASPHWLASNEVLGRYRRVRFWRREVQPWGHGGQSTESTIEYDMVELTDDWTIASQ